MSGGFLPSVNFDGTPKHDTRPFRPDQVVDDRGDGGQEQEGQQSGAVEVPLLNGPIRLTSKQEARLRAYLDDKLLDISRSWKKRYVPNSTLESLPAFLSAHKSLLSVLSSIPPSTSSSTSLLTSYLLRLTSDLSEGICGYSINQSQSLRLSQTVILLDLLDKAWAALNNGRMINFKIAEAACYKTEEKRIGTRLPSFDGLPRSHLDDDDDDQELRDLGTFGSGSLDPFASNGRSMSSTPAPFNSAGQQIQAESYSILGSKGTSTLGLTNKVRLRNLLVGSKENMFIWMRKVLNLPPPPELLGSSAGEEAEELFGWRNTSIDSLATETIEEEREAELELDKEESGQRRAQIELDEEVEEEMDEVVIDDGSSEPQSLTHEGHDGFGGGQWDGAETEEQRQEHEHYRQLFDRKLDPDASDSEEEKFDRSTANTGLQIKSASTSAQPLSFINSRSEKRLASPRAISSSKAASAGSENKQKKRKHGLSNGDDALPKLNTNSRTENSSILSRLNQLSEDKREQAESVDLQTSVELPYEGAPARKPHKESDGRKKDPEKPAEDGVSSEDEEQQQEDSEDDLDGNGSEATFSGSMASSNNVLLWDLTFARLFSRTLKGLAAEH